MIGIPIEDAFPPKSGGVVTFPLSKRPERIKAVIERIDRETWLVELVDGSSWYVGTANISARANEPPDVSWPALRKHLT